MPGNTKSLWHAVNIAKNNGLNIIPENMSCRNIPVVNVSESFAEFFDKKVTDIVNQTLVNPSVYNGRWKINANADMFMTRNNIIDCINMIKLTN